MFPAGAQTTTVTVTAGLTDGTVEHEPITFTPTPQQVINTALKDIRESDPVTLTPDWSTGTGQIQLLNTDAAGYLPSGWTYKVQRGDRPAYFVEVPASLGATVDLSALTPVAANPGTYDLLVPLSELGGAALLNVGTVADTVAAGNDSRFGTIGGIAVTGTPAPGKVPTATSGSAISWQTPASGGGGTTIRTAAVRITDDNLGGLPSASSWTVVLTSASTPLQCSVAAAAGDRIRVCGLFMRNGSHFLDWVLLDSGGAIAEYATTGTGTAPTEGNPTMYPSLSFSYVTGADMFTVGAGNIDGTGKATVALAHQGTASGIVYAHPTYPWRLRLENLGPEPA